MSLVLFRFIGINFGYEEGESSKDCVRATNSNFMEGECIYA
jgi:hypothetical protein